MDFEDLFPHVKKTVEDFLFDEEGNIPRSKILTIGSMMIVLSLLLPENTVSAHRSHSSHRTHSTHSSHRSGGHATHYTHSSHTTHSNGHYTHSTHGTHSTHSSHSNGHTSHGTHSNHSTHSTHSNHSTHNNAAPEISKLEIQPPIKNDNIAVDTTEEIKLPMDVETPIDSIGDIESMASTEMNIPPDTPTVK